MQGTRALPWLFGPAPDLLLGCGLMYAVMMVVYIAGGEPFRAAHPAFLAPLLIMLFSMPHYGATLVRVYERREDRDRYRIFTVWITAAILGLFFVAAYQPYLAALTVTLYLSWSPWHYTGQNYGLAVMFLRRAGVEIDGATKRWLYWSFVSTFAMTLVALHISLGATYDLLDYDGAGINFLPIGIPMAAARPLMWTLGGGFVVSTVVALALLLRHASPRQLAPALALMLTQSLWFTLPVGVRFFGWRTGFDVVDQQQVIRDFGVWVFLGHAIQYLWVTSYYARASEGWNGFGTYAMKVLAAGLAVWTIPFMLVAPGRVGILSYDSGTALLVSAVINLHHFVLDGAIWKLRNSRIASILIRTDTPQPTGPSRRRQWTEQTAWAVCGAATAAAIFGFYQLRFALPAAETPAEASRILDTLALLGVDRAAKRVWVGDGFERAGDFEAARAEYARSLELRPSATAWARVGRIAERQRDYPAASAAYAAGLALEPGKSADFHAALGSIARRSGVCARAVEHYRTGLELEAKSAVRMNDLAWTYATCPDASARQPERAVELAERANAQVDDPNLLGTLAAAYAAAGRFDAALETSRRAILMAEETQRDGVAGQLREQRAFYREGRPFVETPSIPKSAPLTES